MRIHLREKHGNELVKDLPLRGKGFNMDYRIGFVIDRIKQKPKLFYDHKTAKICLREVKSYNLVNNAN
jgi:hypothetical protein